MEIKKYRRTFLYCCIIFLKDQVSLGKYEPNREQRSLDFDDDQSSTSALEQPYRLKYSRSLVEQRNTASLCVLEQGSMVCQAKYILQEKISVIYHGTKQHLICGREQVFFHCHAQLPSHTLALLIPIKAGILHTLIGL